MASLGAKSLHENELKIGNTNEINKLFKMAINNKRRTCGVNSLRVPIRRF